MPNSSKTFLNLLSFLNSTRFQFKRTLFYSDNKNTEYKTKFRLPKGPKNNVLKFNFSYIFDKFKKMTKTSTKLNHFVIGIHKLF